jgi:hypothetical protein
LRTEAEIIALSETKLRAAELLIANGFFDESYYLAGYCFELLLKARICKTLGVPDFYLFDTGKMKAEGYKPYKVHDYKQLILLSGVWTEFETEKNNVQEFSDAWSRISPWKEESRYESGKNHNDVNKFIESQKIMRSWIIRHL